MHFAAGSDNPIWRHFLIHTHDSSEKEPGLEMAFCFLIVLKLLLTCSLSPLHCLLLALIGLWLMMRN
jgi:hypothetical protein